MPNLTYTPTARVNALLASLRMPTCHCREQTPCFRIVERESLAICWPCASENHAHGYAGTAVPMRLQPLPPEPDEPFLLPPDVTDADEPPAPQIALDSLRAAAPADERPQMAPCTVCGARPTFYGVCGACNERARLILEYPPSVARMRDPLFRRGSDA